MDYVNFQGSVSDLLKIIFLEKKSRNKKFSMRAFARDIGVPPGRLSEIIAGKRNLTLSLALKFSNTYSLSTEDKKALYKLVRAQKKLRKQTILERHFIHPQDFSKICHWKYYALICLVQNSSDGATLNDLSAKMGIDQTEVQAMLTTFGKINLISLHGDRFFAPKMSTTTTQDVLDESIQRFQKDMLQFHISQMTSIPMELREVQSMILPLPKVKLKQAKAAIRKFFNDFENKFGTANTTDIYGLSVQLSPLTVVKTKK